MSTGRPASHGRSWSFGQCVVKMSSLGIRSARHRSLLTRRSCCDAGSSLAAAAKVPFQCPYVQGSARTAALQLKRAVIEDGPQGGRSRPEQAEALLKILNGAAGEGDPLPSRARARARGSSCATGRLTPRQEPRHMCRQKITSSSVTHFQRRPGPGQGSRGSSCFTATCRQRHGAAKSCAASPRPSPPD